MERKMEDTLNRVELKIDKIDDKLTNHLERIAIVEEKQKTDRGSIVFLFTLFMTILGYIIYKVKFSL